MTHHTRRVGTNILLVKQGQILLQRRIHTSWADGMLGIPGGHLEAAETARQAAVREIQEELGLVVSQERLQFFATAVVNGDHEYVYYEFFIELRSGEEPVNAEPERCSELLWCDPAHLPQDVHDSFRPLIEQGYMGGERYLEIGYQDN